MINTYILMTHML